MTVAPDGQAAPATAARRAEQLEALLGDPLDPANPHGSAALLRADANRVAPAATEAALTRAGLAEEFVPRELGGRLGSADELAKILRPVFRRDIALGFGFGITSLFAASPVWAAGDEAQRASLAGVLLGGGRASILHREVAHANSVLRDEFTAQVAARGSFVLGGRKDVVINADRAQAFVLHARTAKAPGRDSHSVLLLDPARLPREAVHLLPRVATAGMRGARFSGVAFIDCPVAGDALVGRMGEGVALALRTFQVNRCLIPGTVIAGVDTVLRQALHACGERRPGAPLSARRGRVLSGVFADLLACDSMAVAGLRALSLYPAGAHLLAAAVKYSMPDLLREDLEELATVLGALGYDRGPVYGGFQKLVRDLPVAGLGHAGSAACLAVLVPRLRTLARSCWFRGALPPEELLRPDRPVPPLDYPALATSGTEDFLTPVLIAAADSLAARRRLGPMWAALADLAESFVLELRALAEECADLAHGTPAAAAEPRACVLASRYALVLAAAACLGVWESHGSADTFLADPSWVVLALHRIGRRLGGAVPEIPEGAVAAVTAELLKRYGNQVSFDLYASRIAG